MRKRVKTKAVIEAEASLERTLKKVGYTGRFKGESVNEIPEYRTRHSRTSDTIPTSGNVIQRPKYSGTEILGIATTHKSNLVPIRKDNKQAAKDAAAMRR